MTDADRYLDAIIDACRALTDGRADQAHSILRAALWHNCPTIGVANEKDPLPEQAIDGAV